MDYGVPERRRTKKDLKRKMIFRAYKVGGKFRTMNVSGGSSDDKTEEVISVVKKKNKKGKR